jgi:putative ATPase
MAINEALGVVEQTGNLPVPLHLRNAPTKLMKQLHYGEEYKYAHDFKDHFVEQEFLPSEIKGTPIWKPQENASEAKMKEFLTKRWKNRY